jgi:hypothetical protein
MMIHFSDGRLVPRGTGRSSLNRINSSPSLDKQDTSEEEVTGLEAEEGTLSSYNLIDLRLKIH